MENDERKSRRYFLQQMAVLLGCQAYLPEAFAAGKKIVKPISKNDLSRSRNPKAGQYRISQWTGDDFTRGHLLRAKELPELPEKAEKQVDFIIVGGGIAGLTAAYKLKEHNFLLLEQYEELGGQSRGGSYRGIDYSKGAAYIGIVDGIYGQLYSELGINPVKLETERNAWYWQGHFYKGVESGPAPHLYSEFKRLIADSRSVWQSLSPEMELGNILEGSRAKLDQTPFSQCLSGYSQQFISLIDSFCRSSFCGGINQVSALSGYSLLRDLVNDTYVFKGGNPAIARALAGKLGASVPGRSDPVDLDSGRFDAGRSDAGRSVRGAFVWKIDLKEDSASVVYSLPDGSVHRVDCRHVIVATPPMVAWRQMPSLPDRLKAQLMQFKFGSYLVANMLMKKKVFDGAYDSFVGSSYTFADITVAETPYMMTGGYKPEMGSVLTVYQPYPASSEGRGQLFLGQREPFASSLVGQMDSLIPGFSSALEEVVLTRWGHALAIVGPGYFGRLAKVKSMTEGPFSLAHSSLQGLPAAESAIKAGSDAAARALSLSAKTNISVI